MVTFNFHGDQLDVVPYRRTVHVVIRRVCKVLGVAFEAQLRKLRNDPSICVIMMVTQNHGDDQRRAVACIDHRSLPLWLATRRTYIVLSLALMACLVLRFGTSHGEHHRT